jgi:hypothetical protein
MKSGTCRNFAQPSSLRNITRTDGKAPRVVDESDGLVTTVVHWYNSCPATLVQAAPSVTCPETGPTGLRPASISVAKSSVKCQCGGSGGSNEEFSAFATPTPDRNETFTFSRGQSPI